jgi:transglutaminase-like putative cysteine protease
MTPLTQSRAWYQILVVVVLAVSTCFGQTSADPYGQRLQDLVTRFGAATPPAKAVLLDRMEDLWEYVNDADSVSKALDRAISGHNESALIRDEAKWHRARIALHERRLADTNFIIETLGFVRDWTLITSHSCSGKKLTADTPLRASPLGVVSIYNNPASICAATAVYSNSAQDVAVRFGANGAASLYVNGVLLKSSTADALGFDQQSAGVRLQAGWNTIAMALDGKNAAKHFAVRLSGPEGGSVVLAADSSRITSNVVPATKVKVTDLLTIAEQAASKSADALDTLGALEAVRGLPTAFVHLQAAARANPSADRWVDVARLCPDQACVFTSLKNALQADSKSTSAKTALADYYLGRKQADRSVELLREVAAGSPNDFIVQKRLADAYCEAGSPTAATEQYRILDASRSKAIWLRRELGLRFEAAGLLGRANSLLNQVWKSNFDDARVRSALQRLAERRYDPVALEMLAQAANIVDPSDPVAQLEIVKYTSAARDFVHQSIVNAVSDSSAGQHDVVTLGRETGQAQLIRASGGDEQTGRSKSTRSNKNAETYFVDAAKLAADAQQDTPRENANIVVLADVTVERMRDNGQSTIQAQQVFYVANDRGARDYSTRTVQFSSANQKLAMVTGHIYKPDGRVIEAVDQGENSVTDNSNAMYFDTRSRVLRFAGLEKGDVMELEYRITPNSVVNPYGNYFGALITFQTGLPQRLRRYVLVAPSERKLNVVEQRMPRKAEITEADGNTVYRWDARDQKPLLSEPRGPALTEIAPYVSVSTFEDWDQLGRWYADLITPQLSLDSELQKVLERTLTDAKSEPEKIQAIYEFVLRNTNYVAMEYGIYSYKPYAVTQVYARRFGDCKDKASLMIAMLRAAGIDAELALVRTRKLGDVSDRATTLAVFNHALAYIPKYEMWLDGTAEFAGSRELPLDDQGAMALTVNVNGSAALRRVPVTLPMQNYTHRLVQAKVQQDGKIVFNGSAYTRGEDAPGLRREYEVAERQKDTLRGNLAQVYPSVKVETVHVDGAHDIERDINVNFSGSLDTFAGQRTLSLVPSWLPHKYVNSLASLESRTQELQLPAPWTTEEELHFVVPDGARFDKLPENLRYDTAFGTAVIRYERRGRELTIATSVQFRKLRIDPSEYNAFRDFCSQIEKAFHHEIKVRLAS